MQRILLPLFLIATATAAADPGKTVATVDKNGTFHGIGAISDPRPEPASNGDLQNVRWDQHDGYERLVFDLHENEYGSKKTPPLKTPGSYLITNETYPCRIVCDLTGRQANGILALPDFSKSDLIRDIHPIIVLDDASVKFAITLHKPAEIEVFELHEPARIVIDIRPVSEAVKRFSVRTPGVKAGEAAGSLEETLFSKGFRETRMLRCEDGSYCIETGIFTTRDEASALAGKIAGQGISVFVEERGINDSPKGP